MKIRLATRNIGTLTGQSLELAGLLDRRCVDIGCLQKMRWKGQKSHNIADEYKPIYHGTSTSKNGIAIAINRNMRKNIAEVQRFTDRLMSACIELDHKTVVHVFSAYTPQLGCPDNEKKTSGKNSTISWQHGPRKTCSFCGRTLMIT